MITILIFDEEIQIYYTNDLKKGTTLKNNDRYRHIVGKNDEEVKDQLVQQNVVADYPYKEASMTDLRVNKKNIVEKDG